MAELYRLLYPQFSKLVSDASAAPFSFLVVGLSFSISSPLEGVSVPVLLAVSFLYKSFMGRRNLLDGG
jgi:hypothetical protein